MPGLRNPARERLSAGDVSLGLGLRQARSVDIAAIAHAAGFDWIFIDLEHNTMSIETAQQIAAAAFGFGITPLVRVPEGEDALAARMLDGGALGIVTPHVQTAAEARRLVDLQKFPPLGRRSVSGPMLSFEFQPVPQRVMMETLNEQTLVVVMLETAEAVANCDEIAAVEGVDVLLIGCADLSVDLGVPGDPAHPSVRAAHERVIAACRRHGKFAGTAGIAKEELIGDYVRMGVRFVLAVTDLAILIQGTTSRVAALRAIER